MPTDQKTARSKSLAAHGATGEPPKMDPVDAFNAGICFACGGTYPVALHLHIPGCPFIDPPVQHWTEFRDRVVPADRRGYIQLRTGTVRRRNSEATKRRFDARTAEGRAAREQLADANSGKVRLDYWPTAKLISSGSTQAEVAKRLSESQHTISTRCQ